MPGRNTLAYYEHFQVREEKKLHNIWPRRKIPEKETF
jgi:hypothetical protein